MQPELAFNFNLSSLNCCQYLHILYLQYYYLSPHSGYALCFLHTLKTSTCYLIRDYRPQILTANPKAPLQFYIVIISIQRCIVISYNKILIISWDYFNSFKCKLVWKAQLTIDQGFITLLPGQSWPSTHSQMFSLL